MHPHADDAPDASPARLATPEMVEVVTMYPEILTDEQGLGDLVHDYYFDLDRFTFDEEAREARMYLGYQRKGPLDDRLLRITDVCAVSINDTERIGVYDLCDVEVSPPTVRLIGCIPIEIVLTIGEQCRIYLTLNKPPPYKKSESGGSVFGRLLSFLRSKPLSDAR